MSLRTLRPLTPCKDALNPKTSPKLSGLVSSDTAILSLRYPISLHTFLRGASTPPKRCDTLPLDLILDRHIRAISHFATYRTIIVRYPLENKHGKALRYYRYKYRAIWKASLRRLLFGFPLRGPNLSTIYLLIRARSTTTRDRICNVGALSPLHFSNVLQWIFSFLSRFDV